MTQSSSRYANHRRLRSQLCWILHKLCIQWNSHIVPRDRVESSLWSFRRLETVFLEMQKLTTDQATQLVSQFLAESPSEPEPEFRVIRVTPPQFMRLTKRELRFSYLSAYHCHANSPVADTTKEQPPTASSSEWSPRECLMYMTQSLWQVLVVRENQQ